MYIIFPKLCIIFNIYNIINISIYISYNIYNLLYICEIRVF